MVESCQVCACAVLDDDAFSFVDAIFVEVGTVQVRVPGVATPDPREHRCEGWEEIVQGIGDDDVVGDATVVIGEDHAITDTWKERGGFEMVLGYYGRISWRDFLKMQAMNIFEEIWRLTNPS